MPDAALNLLWGLPIALLATYLIACFFAAVGWNRDEVPWALPGAYLVLAAAAGAILYVLLQFAIAIGHALRAALGGG